MSLNKVIDFKRSVQDTFPSNRNHILYIYDNFGKILFKNKWENHRKNLNIDVLGQEIWSGVNGYSRILEDFSDKEKSECINFIFQESLKYL
tara:strand:+ start:292 stop:564 length:273 start_codon:yes stop_codon:yes gene_type:complete